MERKVVSFEEFEEIFEDMAFEPEEISLFVNTLLSATDDNVPAFYHYDGVSLVVTPNEATVDCDIVYKDICVEVTLFQPVGEEILVEKEKLEEWERWEEDRRQVEEELGVTPPEEDIEDILEEFLKESEMLKERRSKK